MNPDDQRTSCPGFLDEYGIWNNGFECPPLSDHIRICCGSESRRYCCTIDNLEKTSYNRPEKNSYSTVEPLYLNETKSSTILTLPILLTCILILILIFLFILLSLFFCYRYRNKNDNKRKQQQQHQQQNLSPKTNLLVDHFPFSPPHHQFFLNDNNSQYNNQTSMTKDTLTTNAPSTTTSTSSASGRIPSDIYFNDWKDFLIAGEQPMNIYPTMSSHSNELNIDYHSNYLFHGKRQQHDAIV